MSLTQTGPYPRRGDVQITVTTPKAVESALRFRIPAWTGDRAVIYVNGRRQPGEFRGGAFAEVKRTWKSGDHIELELPSMRRLEPVDARHPDLVALVQGPLVLFALSDKPVEMSRRQLLEADLSKAPVAFKPFMDIGDQAYCTYQKLSI